MEPKVFSGKQGEHFKTWAKKVRPYVNGHKLGFKKILQWVEMQQEPINPDQMNIDWPHKGAASVILYDFLMIHTADDAQVCIELVEDNGAEAWRQLCRRYDPIGESFVLDQMGDLMNVPRCKSLVELPGAIAEWERLHNVYSQRTNGSTVPEEWKLPILFKMIIAAS